MRVWEDSLIHSAFVDKLNSLPVCPSDGVDYWYSGYDYILCRTEDQAIELADLIGYNSCGPCPSYEALEYGYFDLESDKESGIEDDPTTGWWFVRDNTFWDD